MSKVTCRKQVKNRITLSHLQEMNERNEEKIIA